MNLSNWIQVTGWVVALITAIISGLIVHNLTQEKKVIAWSIITEYEILTPQAYNEFGKLELLINSQPVNSASIVKLKIRNRGNKEIDRVQIEGNLGTNATIYSHICTSHSRKYNSQVKVDISKNPAMIEIPYLNVKQVFEITFMVGEYRIGEVSLDMSEKGINLVQESPIDISETISELAANASFPANILLAVAKQFL